MGEHEGNALPALGCIARRLIKKLYPLLASWYTKCNACLHLRGQKQGPPASFPGGQVAIRLLTPGKEADSCFNWRTACSKSWIHPDPGSPGCAGSGCKKALLRPLAAEVTASHCCAVPAVDHAAAQSNKAPPGVCVSSRACLLPVQRCRAPVHLTADEPQQSILVAEALCRQVNPSRPQCVAACHLELNSPSRPNIVPTLYSSIASPRP